MQYVPATRRTQFSSCDSCRQSRVACDASKAGYQPGETRWNGSCSRCTLRNRTCTFEWIKKTPARQRELPYLYSAQTGLEPAGYGHPANQTALIGQVEGSSRMVNMYSSLLRQDRSASCELLNINSTPSSNEAIGSSSRSIDELLSRCSDLVFNHGIGPIFGRWVGRYGCPFLCEPASDVCTPPTKLFRELDTCMADQLDDHADEMSTEAARQEADHQIDQSLRRAMLSYAAQWLPLLGEQENNLIVPYDQIMKDCWRVTRREMLKIINRKSYRSVLALYLFSQTAVPVGISEDEEQDGISGVICNQTAYLQIQQLRERLRNSNFDCSEASAWSESISTPARSPNISDSFLSLESRAFWAAITWDTCSSMTLNFRSSLSSGLKGACLETSWRLARGFLVGSFQSRTETWRKQGFEVSDEIAQEITSAVAVCIIYTWRTIASVKEALREGVEEESVLFSWKAVLDALDIFKTTIHPLLNTIEKQLHFLSQVNRLYWYEMVMHYYLGILMLVEALEIAKRIDLSSQVTDARLEAEHGCFNNLKFGLEGKYAVDSVLTNSQTNFDEASPPSDSHQLIVTSFVAIDPYPHHVVASVRLVYNAISRKYRQGNIKYEAFYHLSSTLLRVLAELPQSSKAVQLARKNLQHSINRLETSTATGPTYME